MGGRLGEGRIGAGRYEYVPRWHSVTVQRLDHAMRRIVLRYEYFHLAKPILME